MGGVVRIISLTWIAGALAIATLFISDYYSYDIERSEGIAGVRERAAALDALLGDLLLISASIPTGEDTDEADIERFRQRMVEWGGRKSDYEARLGGKRFKFYSDADHAISQVELSLAKANMDANSLSTLSETMLRNYDQARYYRNQARLARREAADVSGPFFMLYIDPLLEAQGYDSMAIEYERNAKSAAIAIGERTSRLRSEVNRLRKLIADGLSTGESLASRGYPGYLSDKIARFNLSAELEKLVDPAGHRPPSKRRNSNIRPSGR
ncbi:MAG: hypothetical protein HRF49_04785 [bacterium]|jgi:hypothetical protein